MFFGLGVEHKPEPLQAKIGVSVAANVADQEASHIQVIFD